jgi:predicted nucleic acid-binding protein
VRVAYVDTSCLVAIVLGEPGGPALARRLEGFDRLLSSNLLEAELATALVREGVDPGGGSAVDRIDWVLPPVPLGREIERVLAVGYARGADVWHLACALWVQERLATLELVTLDARQRELAHELGLAAAS